MEVILSKNNKQKTETEHGQEEQTWGSCGGKEGVMKETERKKERIGCLKLQEFPGSLVGKDLTLLWL